MNGVARPCNEERSRLHNRLDRAVIALAIDLVGSEDLQSHGVQIEFLLNVSTAISHSAVVGTEEFDDFEGLPPQHQSVILPMSFSS